MTHDEIERAARGCSIEPRIYRIIRFREGGRPRTLRTGLTLAEAQAHCSRPDTHGTRAGRRWFDGYDYMKGYRP